MKTYRIIKNRRPIGQRVLLQQGEWVERRSLLTGNDYREFKVAWEHECVCRAAAEKRLLLCLGEDAQRFIRDRQDERGKDCYLCPDQQRFVIWVFTGDFCKRLRRNGWTLDVVTRTAIDMSDENPQALWDFPTLIRDAAARHDAKL